MIPKIIHYCWFGKGDKTDLICGCKKSWGKLKKAGYLIIEWNEDNCDINENAFVKEMYRQKKWAFVSDYFRLKALYEWGGIYIDTDVLVYKKFDDILDCNLLLGFIYDCALGTAVIGASKENKIIKNFLDQYQELNGKIDVVNNGVFTEYFYNHVKGFKLNGKRQSIVTDEDERIEIFPKTEFEAGKIIGKSHTLHFADGSWRKGNKEVSYSKKLQLAKVTVFNLMSFRQHQKANAYMRKLGKYQNWYRESKNKDN